MKLFAWYTSSLAVCYTRPGLCDAILATVSLEIVREHMVHARDNLHLFGYSKEVTTQEM